jgi:hypothetical protein
VKGDQSKNMNPLQRTLIEKLGHDNGFEHVLASEAATVILASARHRVQVEVSVSPMGGFGVLFHPASPTLLPELQRLFACSGHDQAAFHANSEADLAVLLRRAASLSQALPSQAVQDYRAEVDAELAKLPASVRGTEIERQVRQRVGQDRYRDALLTYWGGACAVTGVSVTDALRASHAKPWAECVNDAERLDTFNGFLLVANLDALFDCFLISFDDAGRLLISARLSQNDQQGLGIHSAMKLRRLTSEHQHYLQWHRERFSLGA